MNEYVERVSLSTNVQESSMMDQREPLIENNTKHIIFWRDFFQNGTYDLSPRNVSENLNSTGIQISLSQESLVGLIILYTITTLLSITGNIFVVLVFVKGRHSRTDLRPFLLNLAVADLVMAFFCMPFTFADTIMGRWVFSPPLCTLVLFVQLFAVAASVLTNMAIGIDRFLAVTFPLRSRVTYARSKYVIAVIWTCSFSLAAVQFFVGRAVNFGETTKCIELWPDLHRRRIYTICILLFTYIIPLLILSITYTIVGILLWKRTAPGNKDHVRDLHRLRSKIKIVKMLVIVVAVFGICWLPIHVFTLTLDFNPEILNYKSESDAMFLMTLFLCIHWLAMSNSFANPIIYGFTNENFRVDLATLFYMWFPCCGCLQRVIPRIPSSSTHESVILRQQSTFRRTARNGSTYISSAYKHMHHTPTRNNTYFTLRQSSKESSTDD